MAIRFSNRELAPLWGAGLRFLAAAALVTALMLILKLEWPRGRTLAGAMLFGLLQFTGALGLFYVALVAMQAGVGQTLLALVPLATLLLAVVQRQERLDVAAVVGTLLGLAGIGAMYLQPGQDAIPAKSLALVLVSVLCFAQALVLVRRLSPVHPVALNAVGMGTGAAGLLVLSIILGEPKVLPTRPETWAAFAYVIALGSVLLFLLHVFVVQHWTASRASYVMVTIPFVTVLLSARLDQEPVTGGLVVGGLLVLVGVHVGALRPARRATLPRLDSG